MFKKNSETCTHQPGHDIQVGGGGSGTAGRGGIAAGGGAPPLAVAIIGGAAPPCLGSRRLGEGGGARLGFAEHLPGGWASGGQVDALERSTPTQLQTAAQLRCLKQTVGRWPHTHTPRDCSTSAGALDTGVVPSVVSHGTVARL